MPVFLSAVFVAALLSGCGAAAGSGSKEGSRSSESTDKPAETTERSEPSGYAGSSRPPESTLSYGGETVVGGLGSYCWSSASVSKRADAFGVAVRDKVLSVPTSSTLTFAYGGEKLGSLNAAANIIGKGNHLEKIDGGSVLVPEGEKGYKTIHLPARRSGNRARIATELPAGNYVVETSIRVP